MWWLKLMTEKNGKLIWTLPINIWNTQMWFQSALCISVGFLPLPPSVRSNTRGGVFLYSQWVSYTGELLLWPTLGVNISCLLTVYACPCNGITVGPRCPCTLNRLRPETYIKKHRHNGRAIRMRHRPCFFFYLHIKQSRAIKQYYRATVKAFSHKQQSVHD